MAVDLDASSASALKCAHDLAQSLGMRLRVVHAAPEALFVGDPPAIGEPQPALATTKLTQAILESVQRWAALEVKVPMKTDEIRVGFGEPAEIILCEAREPDVDMVVIGGPLSTSEIAHHRMLPALLRACPRPLLCSGPRGPQPVVVAATDCSDPALPVFQNAWLMATALGSRLKVVHNVDRLARRFAQRIGTSTSPRLAALVAARSRQWLEEVAGAGEIIITRNEDDAKGVLGVARALQAELLVVGVKPAHCASRKTAERILAGRRSSILFVPLGSASERT